MHLGVILRRPYARPYATGMADGRLWLWRDSGCKQDGEEGVEGGESFASTTTASAAALMEARLDVGIRLILHPPDVQGEIAR